MSSNAPREGYRFYYSATVLTVTQSRSGRLKANGRLSWLSLLVDASPDRGRRGAPGLLSLVHRGHTGVLACLHASEESRARDRVIAGFGREDAPQGARLGGLD